MPDAIITSTASTFGTISGTFAADQSTIVGTVAGSVVGNLSGSVGVPGPAGPGVPAGGTAGQYLQKIDGVDYNTDWVTLNLSGYAPLNSPLFTGDPRGPTAALGDNDTSLATTAFVQQELASGTAVAKNLEVYVRNQTGSTLAAGAIVYINGATGNRPTVTLAQANNDANSAQTMGFVKASIANNGFGYVIVRGEVENLDTSALTEGVQLYLSPTTAGAWTTTKPSAPQHLVYVGIVIRSHPTQGVILVAVQNGYELNELHDVAISSPTNGQVLKYNSSTGLWVNGTDSSGVAWGGITGTLSSQTDLQTALDGKYSTSNPAGYITSSALSPYLTSATAASTYQTIAGMSSYLTTSAAASTYYPLINPSGYITSSALTGYATESWVTSQGYLVDAPSDGSQYLRQNGAWTTVNFPPDFITSVTSPLSVTSGDLSIDLSAYETVSSAAATYQTISGMSSYLTTASASATYQTISGMNAYLTTSAAASTYLTQANAASTYFTIANAANKADLASPVFTGNPTAPTPATGDNDTSIATTAFVKAQGYLTSAPVTSVAGKTGAVTLVVADVSGAAPLASPGLTGTPTAPTAAAATNTTQIATTAFVQQEVPAASTTAAGKVELATTAEVIVGTSTSLVSPLSEVGGILTRPELRPLVIVNNTAVSGSGGINGSGAFYGLREMFLGSLATGRASFNYGLPGNIITQPNMSRADWSKINFGKKIWMSGKSMCGATFSGTNYIGDANTFTRVTLGGYSSNTTGDMTLMGIGWKKQGGTTPFFTLTVHNGTTLTDVATSVTHSAGKVIDWVIYSDGTGNVTLYIDGNQAATTTAGPTGIGNSGAASYREQVEAATTPGVRQVLESVGGWLYIEG